LPYIVFKPCPISLYDIGATISVYHSIAENSIGNFKMGLKIFCVDVTIKGGNLSLIFAFGWTLKRSGFA